MALQTQCAPVIAIEERQREVPIGDGSLRTTELAVQIKMSPPFDLSALKPARAPLVQEERAVRPVQSVSIQLPPDWKIPKLVI